MTPGISVTRETLTLAEAAAFCGFSPSDFPHITYDPAMTRQYRRRDSCRHDSTALFSIELMRKTLMPLISRVSYYRPNGAPVSSESVRYVVGPIKVFSIRDTTRGFFNGGGQREGVSIPVREFRGDA